MLTPGLGPVSVVLKRPVFIGVSRHQNSNRSGMVFHQLAGVGRGIFVCHDAASYDQWVLGAEFDLLRCDQAERGKIRVLRQANGAERRFGSDPLEVCPRFSDTGRMGLSLRPSSIALMVRLRRERRKSRVDRKDEFEGSKVAEQSKTSKMAKMLGWPGIRDDSRK